MFKAFGEAVHQRYAMLAEKELYSVDVVDIFASYLLFFPEGTNPVFRKNTEHECSCCKHFVRRLGGLVAIEDGKVLTVWDDFAGLPHPYNVVSEKMAELIRQAPIRGIFRTKERQFGTESNFDSQDATIKWQHFHGRVLNKHFTASPDEAIGEANAVAQVLRRGLTELKSEDFVTVLDLIDSNALYRGEEHKPAILNFRKLMQDYEIAQSKDLFVWANLTSHSARFRNTVIGTLLVDLAAGVPLEDAVKSFETKVAPQNYKRTSALITTKMVEQAVEKLKELGLEGAVHRRYAKLSDISVNNVLFVDNSVKAQMKDSLSELLKDSVKTPEVNIKSAAPIKIKDFLTEVLPKTKSMSLLVKNTNRANFVSLTYGDNTSQLFKWRNNFAWSYDGEVTDSIKEKVKRAGGRVQGAKLRVSLAWYNFDDLDLHCEVGGQHIYFRNKANILDVDMNAGGPHTREPVENMSWMTALRDGVYCFYVHQFSQRENVNYGFSLELETEGRLDQYSYHKKVFGNVSCLIVTVMNGRVTAVEVGSDLKGGSHSQDVWGIKTETLVPIETLLTSPNHWDGQAIGNKHWFFILKGCRNPEATRGIYNEFLRSDLDPYRKVFEVLGSKTKCPSTGEQLSGVGFSSTRNDEAVIVADGRAFNIQF